MNRIEYYGILRKFEYLKNAGVSFPTFCRRHVKDVRDAARESDHNDDEGHQEEEDVLHHVVHAQDDRAEVLRSDADLEKSKTSIIQDRDRSLDPSSEEPGSREKRTRARGELL